MPVTQGVMAWELVHLEMRFVCPDPIVSLSVATHAQRWVESRNPFYVDAAVSLCGMAGVQPPAALVEFITEVARLRLTGDQRGGTSDQIFREVAKSHALELMALLCAADISLKDAASYAAAELLNARYGAEYKASTLEQYYTQEGRKREERWKEHFATPDGAANLASWLDRIKTMPKAPADMIGERR